MRFFELAAQACFVAAIASCATSLHDDGTSAPVTDASAPLPIAKGCLPLHDVAHVESVAGSMHTVASRGSVLVIADDATVDGNDVASLGMSVPSSDAIDGCLGNATFQNGAPQSVIVPSSLSVMSAFAIDANVGLFFSEPFVGVGATSQDLQTGLFSSSGSLLFTADRPAYGTATVVADGFVYAYGCTPARFLDADCYVARVASASLANESQYSFYTGGGQWSPRIEDAWPTTSGGTSIDVTFVSGRYLMLFIAPLGNTISARYGVAPEGPWSASVDLATCDLADPDQFCAGIHAHPEIAAPPGTIAVSYAIASLSSDVGARRASNPDAWWPRLFALPIPPIP